MPNSRSREGFSELAIHSRKIPASCILVPVPATPASFQPRYPELCAPADLGQHGLGQQGARGVAVVILETTEKQQIRITKTLRP